MLRGLGATIAAGAVLAVALAAPAGATNFYGNAGYQLSVNVTKLSAQWRIPAVSPRSGPGHALTLVGAFYPPAGVVIEAGTAEDVVKVHGHDRVSYSAFWSPDGYSIRRFHLLHAGDEVTTTIEPAVGAWRIHIDDTTARWQGSITVRQFGATQLDEAAFLQQDPATDTYVPSVEASPVVPYPEVGGVTFTHVQLNGRPPQLSWPDALMLTVPNGTYLLPTHAARDGFSVFAAGGAARQYLADVTPEEYAYRQFNVVFEHWAGSTDGATRARESQFFLESQQRFAHQLLSQRWPPSVRADITTRAQLAQQLVSLLQDLPTLQPSNLGTWTKSLVNTFELSAQAGDRVHADLGLPLGN